MLSGKRGSGRPLSSGRKPILFLLARHSGRALEKVQQWKN